MTAAPLCAAQRQTLECLEFKVQFVWLDSKFHGKRLNHGVPIWTKAGRVRIERSIGVSEPQLTPFHLIHRMAQQLHAVRILESRVGAGEVLADIAQPCRPEQRVRQRVRQYVRIRMALQTTVMLDPYPAQDECPALHQRMAVEPKSNTRSSH